MWAGAERLVAEAEASGTQINARIATSWLACYGLNGEWRGAERVWHRMAELNIAPDAASYCALMRAYTGNGEAEQLAKIEPLYTEMINGSGPAGAALQFSAGHFERLIRTALRCRLAAEARKWAERAKAVGLWEQLDKAIRRIVSTADHWGEESAVLREKQESAPAIDSASLLQRGSKEQPARDNQHGKSDRDAPAPVPTAAPASGRDARRSINALQTLVRRGVPLWGGEAPAEMSTKIESVSEEMFQWAHTLIANAAPFLSA
jgi:pentatricopeptide repeat protein